MTVKRIHHVTLRVDDLAAAEAAYRDVFGFDVLFREGTSDGEFGALPADLDWPAAVDAGVDPGMTFLGREDAAVAIAARDGSDGTDHGTAGDESADAAADDENQAESTTSALDHVALHVDPGDVSRMAARARERGWEVDEREDAAFLVDADGIEWEVNASDPPPATPFDELPVP